jgi:hypothetical protein
MTTNPNVRERLAELEARLRSLRGERSRAQKVFEIAKATAESVPEGEDNDAQVDTAQSARDAVKSVESEIAKVEEEQKGLLRQLAGSAGFSGVNGWADAARRIDLARGETRVDMAAQSLLQAQIGSGAYRAPGSATSVTTPSERAAAGQILYSAFPQQGLAGAEFAISDFTISFSASGVTGVERPVDATTEKADVPATVALATPQVRQFAVTIHDVPAKLFDNFGALTAFLEQEMRRRLDLAIDEHVVGKIVAATPPSGSTGTGLVEQVRHAVAASRALGASPSVLALNPTDAAALDLTTVGADGLYLFAVRDTSSSSPLWALSVIESPAVDDPLVLDPARLGVLYAGTGTILADPYSGMESNLVRVRVEVEAYLHVRNDASAYVIA